MSDEPIFAFVLMPFSDEFDDIYKFGIKETAKNIGIKAERVDEQLYSEGILSRIYSQIDQADLIITDMTGRNPNVFYEVGYAHAKNKICLHLTQDTTDIPFDLQHQRHIVYGGSIESLREQLVENLEWAKKEIENYRKSLIRLQVRDIGTVLDKSKHIAKGTLNFRIDLFNDSEDTSQEIESIYFYTGNNWNIKQGDSVCEQGESDILEFKQLYLLRIPQTKISRKSWLPLRFSATRTLDSSWDERPLENKYDVKGKALLRIATSNGIFDHEISIDVTCDYDDIPF